MIAASGVTMVAVATACAILAASPPRILAGLRIDFGRLGVIADLADAVETATADPFDFAG
jgi:hypothetical protein